MSDRSVSNPNHIQLFDLKVRQSIELSELKQEENFKLAQKCIQEIQTKLRNI